MLVEVVHHTVDERGLGPGHKHVNIVVHGEFEQCLEIGGWYLRVWNICSFLWIKIGSTAIAGSDIYVLHNGRLAQFPC